MSDAMSDELTREQIEAIRKPLAECELKGCQCPQIVVLCDTALAFMDENHQMAHVIAEQDHEKDALTKDCGQVQRGNFLTPEQLEVWMDCLEKGDIAVRAGTRIKIRNALALREQLREVRNGAKSYRRTVDAQAKAWLDDAEKKYEAENRRLRDAIGALTPHEYRLLSDDVDLICGEEVEQRVVAALRALAEIAAEGE